MSVVSDDMGSVFRRQRGLILLTLLLLTTTLLAGTALLSLAGHFLTAAALAGGLASGFNLFGPSSGIRFITFVRIASRYGEKLVGHDLTLRLARDLRIWFFRRALPLAPIALGRERIGDLLTRLVADIEQADGLIVRAVGPMLALLALCVITLGIMALVLPAAALWVAVTLLSIAVLVPLFGSLGAGNSEASAADARAQLRHGVQEGLEGAADLVALDATEHHLSRIFESSRVLAERERRLRRRTSVAGSAHGFIVAFALPVLLWLLLQGFSSGTLSAPAAAAMLFASIALYEAATGIAPGWQSWRNARASMTRLNAIAMREHAIDDPTSPIELPEQGTLELDRIRFHWDPALTATSPILDRLNLTLPPGERIAIAGDSGVGKSSLAALLLRLRDPDAGAVRFGGVDATQCSQFDWHRRIAWLPQDAPIFAGTIRQNLLLGNPQADEVQLWNVLERVRLDDAIRGLCDGLDGWVGEGGTSLSAGQARRLALARALLLDTPILLLDEPTEGLDADTADALLLDLASACAGRSLILITHGSLPEGVVHKRYRLQGGQLEADSGRSR